MNTKHDDVESRTGPSHASIFVWLFAVSIIWHYTSSGTEIANYWLRYDPLITPLIFLSIVSAFIAACFPNKTAAVMVMCVSQLIALGLRFPFVADHLAMELILHLSIVCAFLYVAIRGRTFAVSLDEMFAIFSPVGRWLLIIMYFYGTFHKINPGFMSIDSSCALPFITGIPILRELLGSGWMEYAAIYGTLILEAIAMLLLLSRRTKYFGMLLGMSFHFIIGISGYGTLAHFSAYALAMHALFLPSGFGQRIYNEPLVPTVLKSVASFRIVTITLIALQIVFALHLGFTRQGFLVNTLFAIFAIVLMFLVFKHGQMRPGDSAYRLKPPVFSFNLLTIWFFLHCASPYIGLGTGGALAMFSGLRTEGGISNHYIIRSPIPLFSYQDKIIYIEQATNVNLQEISEAGQGMVLFDFQRHFSYRDQLTLPLTVRIDGIIYRLDDAASLTAFVNEHFVVQSWLERKYMSFRLVDDPQPKQCRH